MEGEGEEEEEREEEEEEERERESTAHSLSAVWLRGASPQGEQHLATPLISDDPSPLATSGV